MDLINLYTKGICHCKLQNSRECLLLVFQLNQLLGLNLTCEIENFDSILKINFLMLLISTVIPQRTILGSLLFLIVVSDMLWLVPLYHLTMILILADWNYGQDLSLAWESSKWAWLTHNFKNCISLLCSCTLSSGINIKFLALLPIL